MRRTAIVAALAAALMVTMLPANAAVHELTGSECNGRGGVIAPGQEGETPGGLPLPSGLAALQATGLIASIVLDVPPPNTTTVTVTFDYTVPSSKYRGSGVTVMIGADPTLILLNAPELDPDFAAHDNCKNLR